MEYSYVFYGLLVYYLSYYSFLILSCSINMHDPQSPKIMNEEEMPKTDVQLALINQRLDQLGNSVNEVKTDVKSIKDETSTHFATKEELGYIKEKLAFHDRILYGFIGLIVVAVFGAILRLVIIGGA